MELNSFPDRLDLADANCRHAMNSGVKVAIATDAHSVEQMDYIKYGITTARRGWLEAKDVLNTVRGKDILKRLHGGRP
jgi:DNA polymerase (family 10)